MRRSTGLATTAFLLLTVGATAQAQSAGSFDACLRGGSLTAQGIGPLKIGLSPDSLKKVCRVIAERRIHEDETTRFVVPVGSDTLDVYEQLGRVFWIAVRSPAFRTADSIGVGSPIGRLLGLEGLDGGVGDGTDAYELNATRGSKCGLVFWVDAETATMISGIARRNASLRDGRPTGPVLDVLRQRANSGRVIRIDIRGCVAVVPKRHFAVQPVGF